MSENSTSSQYSGGENSNSSEYSGGPKKWQNLLRIFGLLRKFWRFRNFWLEVFWRFKKLLVQSRSNHDCTTSEFRFCLDTPLTILLVLNHGSLFWPLTLIILTIQMCRITNVEFAKGKYRNKNPHFFPCIDFWRPETYPESFYFKPLDPPKKSFFWGASVSSNIFSILEIRPWFKIWKTLKEVLDRSLTF